ncbi:hypothetical protein [Mycobacterium sp. IEC1808]|uniref:hypothetical protein n=1 Tax=Mycobacterium sp. IEC1808 TaxID=1743230 RepID=UPI001150D407|nr:hypothetical protein [Mycobacterium sp. IEC1808]
MRQPHRSLAALPAVAATAAAVALASGCSNTDSTAQRPPSSTVGSEATTSQPMPGAGEEVLFERNIKPLFRADDRDSMKWAFDLWSYNDVKAHATAIVQRLRDGSMPCDGAWPAQKIDVFQRWIDSGMSP